MTHESRSNRQSFDSITQVDTEDDMNLSDNERTASTRENWLENVD